MLNLVFIGTHQFSVYWYSCLAKEVGAHLHFFVLVVAWLVCIIHNFSVDFPHVLVL